MCFATMLVPVCVVLCVSWRCGARSHWNGCMMLHGLCVGEEAGARNRVFFRVKWLQPAMKATSSVRRLRLGSFGSFKFLLCVLQQWSYCNGCMNVAWCCAILLSFAARSRKSYRSGCIQAAIVICQQIFATLALVIFLLKIPFRRKFRGRNFRVTDF